MRDLEYPLARAGGIRSRGTRAAGLGLATLIAVLVLLQAGGDEPGLADPARTASVPIAGQQANRAAGPVDRRSVPGQASPEGGSAPDVFSTPLRSELSAGDDEQVVRGATKTPAAEETPVVADTASPAGLELTSPPQPDIRFARESLTEVAPLPSRPPERAEPSAATAALLDARDPSGPALLDAASTEGPAAGGGSQRTAGQEAARARKLRTARADGKPRLLGRWAPKLEACSSRNAGTPFLALTIGPRQAKAGTAACEFRTLKQAGDEFRGPASCRNGAERWTANLKLVVKGNRLIWTSERGTQAYFRCG